MDKLVAAFGIFVALAGVIFVLAVLMTLPVYFLWNWVGVDILHLPPVTLFQAWGLNVLCGCLFKSSSTSTSSSK